MEDNHSGLFKRRLSLIEHSSADKNLSHRQYLRKKYYQFVRKSHQGKNWQNSISPSSVEKVLITNSTKFEDDQSMPSIRHLREHRHEVGEMLRKTLCRYNYVKHQKEKKQQFLHRKKKKYEKVLQIRQQNLKQKMQMTKSRAFYEREITEEKHRLKKSVDLEKMNLGESLVRCLNQKKTIGDVVRKQQKINKQKILQEKCETFESKKKLHNSVKSEQKKFKAVMCKIHAQKKRNVTQYNLNRVQRQINMMKTLDKKNREAQMRLTGQIKQLQKSKRLFEVKMRNYEQLLKDGGEIRKRNESKFTKKINLSMSLNKSLSINRYEFDDSDFQQ